MTTISNKVAVEPLDPTSIVSNTTQENCLSIAGPIPTVNGTPAPAIHPDQNALDLASYVYNAGFVHAAWADTLLQVSSFPPLRLHALFASRSPLLYRYLSSYSTKGQGPPYQININCTDPLVTHASLSMAIATMYGHSLDLRTIDLAMAKNLIATGHFLGLEHVYTVGYSVLLNSISRATISNIFNFALKPQAGVQTTPEDITFEHPGPYPPITQPLLKIVVDFILNTFTVSNPLDAEFQSLLLDMPFHVYKLVCESAQLQVRSPMERHNFAKNVTSLREHKRKLDGSSSYEETVVLAFGGGKNGIEVIRKPLGKKKVLWKASS